MLLKNAPGIFSKGGGVGPNEFAKAIVTVTKGIIAAAGEFAKNTAPFKEGMYPSVQWGQGVGAALNAFAPVFKALSQDTGWFTSGDDVINNMVNGVVKIAGAIVRVAQKFEWSKMKWDSTPTKAWSWNVSNAIKTYAKLAAEVGEDLFLSNLYLPMKVVNSMVTVGKIIDKNKKAFSSYLNPSFVPILATSVKGYVKLTEFVTSSPAMLLNDTGVKNIAAQMSLTAAIVGKNAKYFNAKIDPNFMKSVASNLFYYMAVAKKLEAQRGGLGSMVKNALGGNPMTNMANGMILLAKAYDKLASSITKMGTAMNNINDKKLSQMERMSRIKTKTESKGFFGSLGETVGSVAGAVVGAAAGVTMVSSGGGGAGARKEKPRVGKYGDIHKQNDMIIDMLRELNEKLGPGSSIDTVMQKKLTEKKDSSLQ